MSALVMADEVDRFNEGERVAARLYGFFALFLWPLSYFAAWLLLLLGSTVLGVELPLALRYALLFAIIAALAWRGRGQLRRLRDHDEALEAFYLSESASVGAAEERLARSRPRALTEAPLVLRLAVGVRDWVLAAPRCSALALFSHGVRIAWSAAQMTLAQELFELLGGNGGEWVERDAYPASVGVMPGLERMALIEHRVANAVAQIRIHPDMRRRYFPKDPAGTFANFPPRRTP